MQPLCPHEFAPVLTWAEAALDLANRPACLVGLFRYSTSSAWYPVLTFFWDLEVFLTHLLLLQLLWHLAVHALHHVLRAPLDPDQLTVCSFYRPSLLETRSQQGLMVNPRQIRGREPLCYASRFLGFVVNFNVEILVAGLWRVLVGADCADSIWLAASDSFLGWHLVVVDY